MTKELKAVRLNVAGRVQGVGFRWATRRVAEAAGVTGYVTNLINGHVKIVAQADESTLKQFVAAIKASPTPYGQVTHVGIQLIPVRAYSTFSVR